MFTAMGRFDPLTTSRGSGSHAELKRSALSGFVLGRCRFFVWRLLRWRQFGPPLFGLGVESGVRLGFVPCVVEINEVSNNASALPMPWAKGCD